MHVELLRLRLRGVSAWGQSLLCSIDHLNG